MLRTTLSSKGQVVLPRLVRSCLHLVAGTRFLCEVRGDSIVLTPEEPVRRERGHVIDAGTGLRVTKADEKCEPVTSEMVKALLEDYP